MQVLCGLQVVFFLFNCQTPGETCVRGMEYVKRGYEDIIGDLKKLGIMVQ